MKRIRKTKTEKPESTGLDLTDTYRPKSIDELYGNSLLKKSLNSVIQQNKIPHAILFFGNAGCGKTSLARILAKELECSDFDCKEIDIADFSGVDLIRDIRRKMHTAPMKGPVKVYILDEAAKMSDAAQTALLKATEEPPKHVYFFICTTDPQKLIPALKQRFVQYQVQALNEQQIFKLLNEVAEKEEITLPKKVTLQIARDSLGSPRVGLKILSKVRYLSEEEMLGAALQEAEKQEQVISLCRAIMSKKSWKHIAEILRGLKEEPESIRRSVRGYFSSVLLNGNTDAFVILDIFNTPYFNTDGRAALVRDAYECCKEFES